MGTLAAVANVIMALPAAAEDAGKLFDFNLTLPFMAAEFLLLMVFLDKTWFTPVGEALKAEAEEILRAARAENQAKIKAVKDECQADLDAKYAAAKAKVDKELETALATLAAEEAEALKSMEAQVEALSADIIA